MTATFDRVKACGPFKTAFIVGGTHGNERTGVMLVRHWQRNDAPVQRESFRTRLLVANPEAVRANTRFIHQDLNRSFLSLGRSDPPSANYELARARDIAGRFATARTAGRVFVIDLHTSTANMGTTLITDTDPVNLTLAAHVQQNDRSINIYAFASGDRIDSCLRAAADGGMGLEIGPIPQGVVRHDVLANARRCVGIILDVLQAWNQGALVPPAPRTQVYLHDRHVYYADDRQGGDDVFVHRDLEQRDFQPLDVGAPVLARLDGTTIRYAGPPGRCPVFINEAAYYREQIAFSLVRPVRLDDLMP